MNARHVVAIALLFVAGTLRAAEPDCPPAPRLPDAQALQAAMQASRDRGFLWRMEKGGRVSYLYGTIHIGRFEWLFPGPAVTRALQDADTLALELDVTDPALAAQASSSPGSPASAPLPAALRARLARLAAAACVEPDALAPLHPVMQAVTLSVLAGRRDGLDPAYGQELALGMLARGLQRPVVSLETVQSQLAALLPAGADGGAALVEHTLEQLERGRVRPALMRLAAAWERGDLAELEHYESWCECADSAEERALLERLNDGRNPALAQRIDALHEGGRRVFAAVGALHMTGPKGLPRLLAARGYTVERVSFEHNR